MDVKAASVEVTVEAGCVVVVVEVEAGCVVVANAVAERIKRFKIYAPVIKF